MDSIHHTLLRKCFKPADLLELREQWQKEGLTVGFTNGVFDILHLGHVDYLSKASSRVDKLILGLNADSSVRELGKGEERPIHPQAARAAVLSGLESVAAVVIFAEDTPLELIKSLKPDKLFKGADYNAEEIDEQSTKYVVGSKEVRSWGGEVQTIELVRGFSTTTIIEKLR